MRRKKKDWKIIRTTEEKKTLNTMLNQMIRLKSSGFRTKAIVGHVMNAMHEGRI